MLEDYLNFSHSIGWWGPVYDDAGQTKFLGVLQAHNFVIFTSVAAHSHQLNGEYPLRSQVLGIHHNNAIWVCS